MLNKYPSDSDLWGKLTKEDLHIVNVGADFLCDSHIQIEMCIENVLL